MLKGVGDLDKGKNKGEWVKRKKEHHQNNQVIDGHNVITLTLKAANAPLFHFPYVLFFSSPPPFLYLLCRPPFFNSSKFGSHIIKVNISLRDLGEGAGAWGPLMFTTASRYFVSTNY